MAAPRLCSIPDCGKPTVSRGWCDRHYRRWLAHEDPLGGGTGHGEAQRFYREVVLTDERGPSDPCLIWPFWKVRNGYAMLHQREGNGRIVSRVLCEEVYGPPPTPDHQAAHSCGKGHLACVTKGHLSWKTIIDNRADMVRHGTRLYGEKQARAKLTQADVDEIRRLRGIVVQRELAQIYGVTQALISHIQIGRVWRGLPDPETGEYPVNNLLL
jgi:hypothetical protein